MLIDLILRASALEQIILITLLVMSVASWMMIVRKIWVVKHATRLWHAFETQFWSGRDLTKLYMEYKPGLSESSGVHNVFCAGFHEFRRLDIQTDPEILIASIQRVMRIAIAKESDYLQKTLTTLASFGSLAPYIGLLGTVVGVMNAFLALASAVSVNATLHTVAPGIAEALVATAMGLFAAIPSVAAFNNFTGSTNALLDNYETFTEEFISILNRKIHQKSMAVQHTYADTTAEQTTFTQRPITRERTRDS